MRSIKSGWPQCRRHVLACLVVAATGLPTFLLRAGPSVPTDVAFTPLAGRTIGVLVPDADAWLSLQNRVGQKKAVVFSSGSFGYRWMYVPARSPTEGFEQRVQIANGEMRTFRTVELATPDVLRKLGVNPDFALVAVTVNDGLGAPASNWFVASDIRPLDGSC